MSYETYDFMTTTPSEEDCVQVMTGENYLPAMTAEAMRMIKICKNKWPTLTWSIAVHDHDFGKYLTVQCEFDPDNEIHTTLLQLIEENWPETWEEAETV
jgi:hypothetical protein